MRTPQLIMMAVMPLLLVTACKKSEVPVFPLTSVYVVNAMPTSNPIVPVFGTAPPQYFSTRLNISYGSGKMFATTIDSNALLIVPLTDTGFTIFKAKLPLVAGGIYSLFLTGDTTKPDTLLVKDNIPPIYTDSAMGVRFVNLSTGSKSLSVNIRGNDPTTQQAVSNLGYLQSTGFIKYVANSTIVGNRYYFEIRDQASGDLLTTYTFPYLRYFNRTIVISGSTDPSSSTPLKVFAINHF